MFFGWKYFKIIIGCVLWLILFAIGCILTPIVDIFEHGKSRQPILQFMDDLFMTDKYINWSWFSIE
jgi:hypothetical protein